MITRYRVLRAHEGDRMYREGEIREGEKADLKHLVPKVLEEIGPATSEKMASDHTNKAAPEPLNKTQPLSSSTIKRQVLKSASEN